MYCQNSNVDLQIVFREGYTFTSQGSIDICTIDTVISCTIYSTNNIVIDGIAKNCRHLSVTSHKLISVDFKSNSSLLNLYIKGDLSKITFSNIPSSIEHITFVMPTIPSTTSIKTLVDSIPPYLLDMRYLTSLQSINIINGFIPNLPASIKAVFFKLGGHYEYDELFKTNQVILLILVDNRLPQFYYCNNSHLHSSFTNFKFDNDDPDIGQQFYYLFPSHAPSDFVFNRTEYSDD